MCWSGEASTVLAAIGIGTTAYAAYKKEPTGIWICLGYFSLMELLQAFTYTVIDQCEMPSNQVATLLGYLHIVFQPFFINAISLHFIDQRLARKIAPFVYTVCFACAIVMIIKLYPFTWAEQCTPGITPICGDVLCSVSGNWHIAWELPSNNIWSNVSFYLIAGFITPLLYGSWRFTVYHTLIGPVLAYMTTDNINEWPAIWCLFSIGLLLIVLKTPIRGILYVKPPKWLKLDGAVTS
jgi:hypothetical protein